MPSHLHWIVDVNPQLGLISAVMRDLKKFAAWDVLEALEKDQRLKLLRMFQIEASLLPDQNRKFWTKRFDDQVIRNRDMLVAKLDYIHHNPVKAGLVEKAEDYKYSSASNYTFGDHSVLHVETEW